MTKPTLVEAMEIGIGKRPQYQFAYFGKCGTLDKHGIPTGKVKGPVGSCILGACYEGRFGYPKALEWSEDKALKKEGFDGVLIIDDFGMMNNLQTEYPELSNLYEGPPACECTTREHVKPSLHNVLTHLNTSPKHCWTREEIVAWLKKVGYK